MTVRDIMVWVDVPALCLPQYVDAEATLTEFNETLRQRLKWAFPEAGIIIQLYHDYVAPRVWSDARNPEVKRCEETGGLERVEKLSEEMHWSAIYSDNGAEPSWFVYLKKEGA